MIRIKEYSRIQSRHKELGDRVDCSQPVNYLNLGIFEVASKPGIKMSDGEKRNAVWVIQVNNRPERVRFLVRLWNRDWDVQVIGSDEGEMGWVSLRKACDEQMEILGVRQIKEFRLMEIDTRKGFKEIFMELEEPYMDMITVCQDKLVNRVRIERIWEGGVEGLDGLTWRERDEMISSGEVEGMKLGEGHF